MTTAPPITPPTTPPTATTHARRERAIAEATDAAAPPRRLRRFAVRGPHCPRCSGPLATGEGARLCAVCGYLEASVASTGLARGRPAA